MILETFLLVEEKHVMRVQIFRDLLPESSPT
jgi:hypothetical protein